VPPPGGDDDGGEPGLPPDLPPDDEPPPDDGGDGGDPPPDDGGGGGDDDGGDPDPGPYGEHDGSRPGDNAGEGTDVPFPGDTMYRVLAFRGVAGTSIHDEQPGAEDGISADHTAGEEIIPCFRISYGLGRPGRSDRVTIVNAGETGTRSVGSTTPTTAAA
jgi:hypothetical protein